MAQSQEKKFYSFGGFMPIARAHSDIEHRHSLDFRFEGGGRGALRNVVSF